MNEFLRELQWICSTLVWLVSFNEIIAHRVCAGWVPPASQFIPEINIARLEACQRLLAHYKNEGNGFLYNIVTGDKFGVSL
jgi:hypothetical protein